MILPGGDRKTDRPRNLPEMRTEKRHHAAPDSVGSENTPDSPARVDIDRLRAALLRRPADAESVVEAGTELCAPIAAAVLFPIVLGERGTTVLLTRRTEHLRDHPGQISFPGGRVEASDPSPDRTALRETQEEIGLASRHVEIAGFLPEYRTATGYRITPVVGFLTPPFALRPDPSEVVEIFEVPLSFLLDPANHQRHVREYQGKTRDFVAMPYERYFIWGATAGIIVSLAHAMLAQSAGSYSHSRTR
jgi:8-oxo-dGTP pyrophosphatase MutT (NUDIX family)